MNAIMSPVWMAPWSIAWPPTHTMSTLTAFMMSMIAGVMNVMTRLVNSWVRIRVPFASSKRLASNSCRSNARMTGRPVSISRATRFTRSMSFCMILNFGMATAMRMPIRTNRHATASTMTQPMETSVVDTMTMPPIARMGA